MISAYKMFALRKDAGFMINFVMVGGCDAVQAKEGTRIACRKD